MSPKTTRLFNKRMREFQSVVNTSEVILGRADGVVNVPGVPYGVFVRESPDSIHYMVYNLRVPNRAGLKVRVGIDPTTLPGVKQVLSVSWRPGVDLGGLSMLPPHEHGLDSDNPIYIVDGQILPLLVYATTGMLINVNPGWLTYQGAAVFVPLSSSIDMTSHKPSSGARYSLVRVNGSGVVSIQDGASVSTVPDLQPSDVPTCEAGYIPLGFVRLYFGQVELSTVYDNPDVIPLIWGGGLLEAPSDTPIQDEKLFTREGAVTATPGVFRLGNHSGVSRTITGIYLNINTAPTGQALIVDVHKNGTTIFTTQANRPQIAAGANSGNSTTIDVPTWANGDYITCDVDQVGTSVSGSNLTIAVVYTE